ncbi:MAG: SDR family oxidoreductase [Armatimonadota bacterium]
MEASNKHVVTGAYGFSGRSITRRLLAEGRQVTTLTNHPMKDDEFSGRISDLPFNFDKPDELEKSLIGADVLYNTYWVRFPHKGATHNSAVDNTKVLFQAAKRAGVKKVVHVSIANPSADSPYPYYRGKALLEQALIESGMEYAILRPTVLFGGQGILINNIAWFMRHLPVFVVPGSGQYKIQPVFVDDLADLAIREGSASGSTILDAVGPEVFTFNEMAKAIRGAIHSRALILNLPAGLAFRMSQLLGAVVGDVVMTKDEVGGLMDNLLVSASPATCTTRLSTWLAESSDWLGKKYMSELKRHY